MYRIQTLNNISPLGLDRFPRNLYEVASELSRPDAIMVRSADMHGLDLDDTIKAIGRAGAGVNNIPVDRMSERGVPVFNAPGANANAVKELVLAGLFLAARNIVQAWDYVQKLDDSEPGLKKKVEAGKKQFKGVELPGRTIGVVGLGAIGVKVANTARDLGMNVLGYDPGITVSNAWRLHAGVEQALSVDELLSRSDFVSIHVPLVDGTEGLIDAKRLRLMRQQAVLLNFSRAEIVDEAAVLEALDADKLSTYVCDFPTMASKNHPEGGVAAASGCLHRRGRGQLRGDGGGSDPGLPRGGQRPQFGEFPRNHHAAHRRRASHLHRQRERAQHGGADFLHPGPA
ncbi:MAG: 3-phosphoglycerate dehydrogenase [Salinisphaeraceae bacterium]